MHSLPAHIIVRYGYPDFLDLPWHIPLESWLSQCSRIEELPAGVSRHPVVFVNYDGDIYAIKETDLNSANTEYNILLRMEEARLPAVRPVGVVETDPENTSGGMIITRYLDRSLPYRSLFMQDSLLNYRQHLLDAMAGLLVQLHLAGFFWGDCSLSNTLFRRDAGALQAYLVDAETSVFFDSKFPSSNRLYDLEMMEENVEGDLIDLGAIGMLAEGILISDTGSYIRVRYQQLWEEITREDIINPGERYRIQDRIRALNDLGFSVGEVELAETDHGDQLQLRIAVTDRNFHRDQLYNLTGLDTEEKQARKLMNEILEYKATLSKINDRSTPMSAAAFYWLEHIYKPVVDRLSHLGRGHTTLTELYCQILEHKWYLSEQAKNDVGHQYATEDYLKRFGDNEEYP